MPQGKQRQRVDTDIFRETIKITMRKQGGSHSEITAMAKDACAELDRLRKANGELVEALEELVDINEKHNQACAEVIGTPPDWKDDYLDKARAAIRKHRGSDDGKA